MRTTRRSLALLPFLAIAGLPALWLTACSSTGDGDDAETGEQGLARRGVEVEPKTPVTPPKRDAGVRPPVSPGNMMPGQFPTVELTYCGTTRFDLRRTSRTCEDLPGALVEGGVTFVPGAGGRFRVTRLLAGTAAPESVASRTCSYTWEPDASCGKPDTAKLLVDYPHEQLAPRMPGCQYLDSGCEMATPPPKVDGGIPQGLGRCEVCGYAASTHLWAVLPPNWSSFSYWAGGQRYSVPISTSQETYDVELGAAVAPQDVTLYARDSAPTTAP